MVNLFQTWTWFEQKSELIPVLEILTACWILFSYSSQIHIRWKKIMRSHFPTVSWCLHCIFVVFFVELPRLSTMCSRKEDFTLIKERQLPEQQPPQLHVWKCPNPYVKYLTPIFCCLSVLVGRQEIGGNTRMEVMKEQNLIPLVVVVMLSLDPYRV